MIVIPVVKEERFLLLVCITDGIVNLKEVKA